MKFDLHMILVLTSLLFFTACSSMGAKPWDRDLLADPMMQLGADATQEAFFDHTYFSKEASSGGQSYAGGGCGCN